MLEVIHILWAEYSRRNNQVAMFNHWKTGAENSKPMGKFWMIVCICSVLPILFCEGRSADPSPGESYEMLNVLVVSEICVEGPARKPVTALLGSVTNN